VSANAIPNGSDAPAGKKKLVILQTHPIQYYAPLYAALEKEGAVDLHVVYLTDAGAKPHLDKQFGASFGWDIPLLEGYRHSVLQPGTPIVGRSFLQADDARLGQLLNKLSPDWILVYGYSNAFIWRALVWAKRRGVRLAYTSDSNLHDPRGRLRRWVKQIVLRPFFRLIDVCLATSEANQAYLEHYGVSKARICRVPFAIDIARFQAGAPGLGVSRAYDFIWAGKFHAGKRPCDFIDALARIAENSQCTIRAAIVGDGMLREKLEQKANRLPSNCSVEFLGFVNQSAMPAALQSTDTLVFTSEREPYGLIATEAAAAGLALIVSDRMGCVGPTVVAQPGINAQTYPAGDVPALVEAMCRTLEDKTTLHRMQAASRTIAQEHDVNVAARCIEEVVLRGVAS